MIWHPHWWKDTGFNRSYMVVEQQCRLCKQYRHWTGKWVRFPGKEWAEGMAERRTK